MIFRKNLGERGFSPFTTMFSILSKKIIVPFEPHGSCYGNALRLRRPFFPAYFCLSPLQKHVRKVVGDFGKKSGVGTGGRKPGNTYMCVTDHHDMTLVVKVALNLNTPNQPIKGATAPQAKNNKSAFKFVTHHTKLEWRKVSTLFSLKLSNRISLCLLRSCFYFYLVVLIRSLFA